MTKEEKSKIEAAIMEAEDKKNYEAAKRDKAQAKVDMCVIKINRLRAKLVAPTITS